MLICPVQNVRPQIVQSIARVFPTTPDAPLLPVDVVFVLHAVAGEPFWSGFGAGQAQQYPAGSLVVCRVESAQAS